METRPPRCNVVPPDTRGDVGELAGLGVLGSSWFTDATILLCMRTHIRSSDPSGRRLAVQGHDSADGRDSPDESDADSARRAKANAKEERAPP
jgi:hypothetical protein